MFLSLNRWQLHFLKIGEFYSTLSSSTIHKLYKNIRTNVHAQFLRSILIQNADTQ